MLLTLEGISIVTCTVVARQHKQYSLVLTSNLVMYNPHTLSILMFVPLSLKSKTNNTVHLYFMFAILKSVHSQCIQQQMYSSCSLSQYVCHKNLIMSTLVVSYVKNIKMQYFYSCINYVL